MNLRTPLSAALFVLLLSPFSFLPAEAAQPPRPNILLLLVDDLKPALGAYGDKVAQTPQLDRLAARGLRFDAAYCNQAVCAPSRFNLFLGARSTSTGIYGFGRNFRAYYPDAVTLPQFFREHGYRTESMGKTFHIGHGTWGDDASWSVPHHKDLVIEYLDPASTPDGTPTNEQALFGNRPRPKGSGPLPRGAAWEAPDVADDAYADGRVAAFAIERLRAAKAKPDEPFFIAVGFARPHLPFSVPKKYWDFYDRAKLPLAAQQHPPVGVASQAMKRGGEIDQYAPVPKDSSTPYDEELQRALVHGYYAGVSYVDAQIGKVAAALEELGLAKNTIVVLWGDHGYHLGDLGLWTKHTNFEEPNRIPLLIVAPGVTRPGASTRALAETVDIYATLAELASLPRPAVPQPFDSVSLAPVLRDPAASVRDHVYHCYPRRTLGRAVRDARYRLVEWKEPGASPDSAEIELYDYSPQGPGEARNVAVENPEVVARLHALLVAHGEAVPARAAAPPPAP